MQKNIVLKKIISAQLILSCLLLILGILCFYAGYVLAHSYNFMIWNLLDLLLSTFSLSIRQDVITQILLGLSWWGYYGSAIIWILLSIYLYKRKEFASLILVAVLSLGGVGLGYGIKNVVQRERPSAPALIHETRQSFPSMHTLTATILYVSLVYFLYHFTHNLVLSIIAYVCSILLLFAIAFSRIYLGVHYFSDCIAGLILGLAYFYTVLGVIKLYWTKKYSLLENSK